MMEVVGSKNIKVKCSASKYYSYPLKNSLSKNQNSLRSNSLKQLAWNKKEKEYMKLLTLGEESLFSIFKQLHAFLWKCAARRGFPKCVWKAYKSFSCAHLAGPSDKLYVLTVDIFAFCSFLLR